LEDEIKKYQDVKEFVWRKEEVERIQLSLLNLTGYGKDYCPVA
jgi:hypothetical protein